VLLYHQSQLNLASGEHCGRIGMKELLKLIGFCLLIIGTLGILITEFVIDQSRTYTLTFAAINAVGLATLAIAHWGTKE